MAKKKKSLGRGLSSMINDQQRDEEENTPISVYRKQLYNAYKDGPITKEAKKALRTARENYGITEEQHELLRSKVLAELKARGDEEGGKPKKKKKKKKKTASLVSSSAPTKKNTSEKKDQWEEEQEQIKDELKDIFFKSASEEVDAPDEEPKELETVDGPEDDATESPVDEDVVEYDDPESEVMYDDPEDQDDDEVEFDEGSETDVEFEDDGDEELDSRRDTVVKVSEYFKEGTNYFTDHQYEKAIEQWEKVLAIDPENKTIVKAIEHARAKLEETGGSEPEEEGPELEAPPAPEEVKEVKEKWVSKQDRLKNEMAALLESAKDELQKEPEPDEPPGEMIVPDVARFDDKAEEVPEWSDDPDGSEAEQEDPGAASQDEELDQERKVVRKRRIDIDFIRDGEESTDEPLVDEHVIDEQPEDEPVMGDEPEMPPEIEPDEPELEAPPELPTGEPPQVQVTKPLDDNDVVNQVLAEVKKIKKGEIKKTPEEIEAELEEARLRDERMAEEAEKAKEDIYNKAVSLANEERFNEALMYMNKVLEADPEHSDAWNDKGVILWSLNRPAEAISAYQMAMDLDPEGVESIINMGVAYRAMGNDDMALKCYNDALDRNGQIEEIWINKGVLLFKMGNIDKAEDCFHSAVKIDPNSEEGWSYRALCLERLGRFQEASTCYDYVLNINPDNKDAKSGKELCAKQIRTSLMKDWLDE